MKRFLNFIIYFFLFNLKSELSKEQIKRGYNFVSRVINYFSNPSLSSIPIEECFKFEEVKPIIDEITSVCISDSVLLEDEIRSKFAEYIKITSEFKEFDLEEFVKFYIELKGIEVKYWKKCSEIEEKMGLRDFKDIHSSFIIKYRVKVLDSLNSAIIKISNEIKFWQGILEGKYNYVSFFDNQIDIDGYSYKIGETDLNQIISPAYKEKLEEMMNLFNELQKLRPTTTDYQSKVISLENAIKEAKSFIYGDISKFDPKTFNEAFENVEKMRGDIESLKPGLFDVMVKELYDLKGKKEQKIPKKRTKDSIIKGSSIKY